VWVFRIENFLVSVWVSSIGFDVGFPHCLLNLFLLAHLPLAIAAGFFVRPSGDRYALCFLQGFNASPLMAWRRLPAVAVMREG